MSEMGLQPSEEEEQSGPDARSGLGEGGGGGIDAVDRSAAASVLRRRREEKAENFPPEYLFNFPGGYGKQNPFRELGWHY